MYLEIKKNFICMKQFIKLSKSKIRHCSLEVSMYCNLRGMSRSLDMGLGIRLD